MLESYLTHALRRIVCMPKCSDDQLNYEIDTVSNKVTHREMCCEDAKPICGRSIASLATT